MEFTKLTADLTYKPGWSFRVDRGWLYITASVQHSETLEWVTFQIDRIIPRIIITPEMFFSWWEDILHEAEYHELREFAKYQGNLINNPHASEPVNE